MKLVDADGLKKEAQDVYNMGLCITVQQIDDEKDLSLKPVKVKNGDKGYFEAYYDPTRDMIFFDWMSAAIARKLGLTIKKEE